MVQLRNQLLPRAVRALLVELAAKNPGLCILTSRYTPTDLNGFLNVSASLYELPPLTLESGSQVLRSLGVFGNDQDLACAVFECKGHAFTLTLLASYLVDAFGGDVRERLRIGPLQEDTQHGHRVAQIIKAYHERLTHAERAVLRTVGLFDRPVDSKEFDAAVSSPGLFQHIPARRRELHAVIMRLRFARLLAEPSRSSGPWPIDAHRLVREYYGEEFRVADIETWRRAHGNVYEYLRDSAPREVMPPGGMDRLYSAVRHGCLAGRHRETLQEIYYKRISRETGVGNNSSVSLYHRGLISSDLVALTNFFDEPWRIPSGEISNDERLGLLARVGLCYRALGYLDLSVEPTELAFSGRLTQTNDSDADRSDLREAASAACNLSRLRLNRGEFDLAIQAARCCMDLAERSGDSFQRIRYGRSLADCLAQAGKVSEADELFNKCERLNRSKKHYGWGFHHCEFRLRRGEYDRALRLAQQMHEEAFREGSLMDQALFQIAIGKALYSTRRDLQSASEYLDRGIAQIRSASRFDYLPTALIARAGFRIGVGAYENGEADLLEARALAIRSGLRLYEVDALLSSARLSLARSNLDSMRAELAEASVIIEKLGYGGALSELLEAKELLKLGSLH